MAEPVLFYLRPSHYCISAERMLSYKGIPFRQVNVPYHDKRELIRETQQDYVPALRWNGDVVTWTQVADFLEETKPRPSLFPGRHHGLPAALASWAHGLLEERVWRLVVTRMPSVFDDEVERWVFEEMQTRARGSFSVLASREAEFREDLGTYLALLNDVVAEQPWMLGEPSLADFATFGALGPLALVGERLPRDLRSLIRWHEAVAAIPSTRISSGRS